MIPNTVCDPAALDREAVVRAVEGNMRAYWLSLGQGDRGVVYDGSDLKWAYTGWPVLNRVFGINLDRREVEVQIGTVLRQFGAWNASVAWLVEPSTCPADLGQQLAARGLVYEGYWAGMALDLTRPDPDTDSGGPTGLTVREAVDEGVRQGWLEILGAAFALPPAAQDVFRGLVRVSGRKVHNGTWWRSYVGFLEDRPVATATLVEAAGVAGIYLVATTPSARRQGFGTALTRHVLETARARGYQLAVLQATETGKALYRKLGFAECCRIGVYRWRPPSWRRRLGRLVRLTGVRARLRQVRWSFSAA